MDGDKLAKVRAIVEKNAPLICFARSHHESPIMTPRTKAAFMVSEGLSLLEAMEELAEVLGVDVRLEAS